MINFTETQLKEMGKGEIIRASNGKRYGICEDCRKLVCLDKNIFHSLHLCS